MLVVTGFLPAVVCDTNCRAAVSGRLSRPPCFVEMDGDMAIYVGTDATGLEIGLGIVRDDRGTGFAVAHAMPRGRRR